jgi:hypothetical protein
VAPEVKGLEAPTAVHADADAQDTPLRKPPPCGGLGVDWTVHRVPSHRSASVPALDLPTAVHADADVHDTAFRPLWPRVGVRCRVHRVPFHRSATASEAPVVVMLDPTAMQADGAVHATPSRVLTAVPGGLGVRRMRQD